MDFKALIDTVQGLIKNWGEIMALVSGVLVAFGLLLSSFNSLLRFIAPFTPWKWDDNLAGVLGTWAAAKIFQKKN